MWDDLSKEARRDFIQGGTASLAEGVKHRNVVCLMEIRYELLGQDLKQVGRNNETRRLANIMNYMPGWTRSEERLWFGEYGRQRGYVRIEQDVLD